MDKIQTAKRVACKFFGQMPDLCIPHGNGHINDTYLISIGRKYILQRVNTNVFPCPEKIAENISGITNHIKSKSPLLGLDPSRCNAAPICDANGEYYFIDEENNYWRAFEYIEKAFSRERIENKRDIEMCGRAFGQFQMMLSDYPTDKLHYTIENFHNTPMRYENLMRAIERDPLGRVSSVKEEIEFVRERGDFCKLFEEAHMSGQLPLRTTHNDTKLNNILFDEENGEAVCIIDLDTVMPGYSINDFGDMIRFAANTAAEDETELSKVSLDLDLFSSCAKGFIEGTEGILNETEISLLPHSAIMMTLETGMRFLTDYIEGDVYYKISKPTHNLDRARCQFALVRDMEKNLPLLVEIISKIK